MQVSALIERLYPAQRMSAIEQSARPHESPCCGLAGEIERAIWPVYLQWTPEMSEVPRNKRTQKLKPASQRRPDIRSDIKGYIDRLIELYERTDPARGPASEDDKLENARRAILMWWYLFGELLLWAQSQLAGYVPKRTPLLEISLLSCLGLVEHRLESRSVIHSGGASP